MQHEKWFDSSYLQPKGFSLSYLEKTKTKKNSEKCFNLSFPDVREPKTEQFTLW